MLFIDLLNKQCGPAMSRWEVNMLLLAFAASVVLTAVAAFLAVGMAHLEEAAPNEKGRRLYALSSSDSNSVRS